MKLRTFRSAHLYAIAVTSVFGATSGAIFAAESTGTASPADPSAIVPPTTYQSALPGSTGRYLKDTDVERRSWRNLFTPDGRFIAERAATSDATGRTSGSSMPMPAIPPGHSMEAMKAMQSTPTMSSAAGASSDARGIIKSINVQQSKIKLKHGPINKFDMPGMTMIFRIKDPRLLEQVKKGDEVGVTLEMDGGAMYITGFQK